MISLSEHLNQRQQHNTTTVPCSALFYLSFLIYFLPLAHIFVSDLNFVALPRNFNVVDFKISSTFCSLRFDINTHSLPDHPRDSRFSQLNIVSLAAVRVWVFQMYIIDWASNMRNRMVLKRKKTKKQRNSLFCIFNARISIVNLHFKCVFFALHS